MSKAKFKPVHSKFSTATKQALVKLSEISPLGQLQAKREGQN